MSTSPVGSIDYSLFDLYQSAIAASETPPATTDDHLAAATLPPAVADCYPEAVALPPAVAECHSAEATLPPATTDDHSVALELPALVPVHRPVHFAPPVMVHRPTHVIPSTVYHRAECNDIRYKVLFFMNAPISKEECTTYFSSDSIKKELVELCKNPCQISFEVLPSVLSVLDEFKRIPYIDSFPDNALHNEICHSQNPQLFEIFANSLPKSRRYDYFISNHTLQVLSSRRVYYMKDTFEVLLRSLSQEQRHSYIAKEPLDQNIPIWAAVEQPDDFTSLPLLPAVSRMIVSFLEAYQIRLLLLDAHWEKHALFNHICLVNDFMVLRQVLGPISTDVKYETLLSLLNDDVHFTSPNKAEIILKALTFGERVTFINILKEKGHELGNLSPKHQAFIHPHMYSLSS